MRAGGLVTVVVVVVALMAGVDPFEIVQALAGSGPPARPAVTAGDGSDEFASVVLADTEEVWHQLFAERGMTYVEPKLVLFDGEVSSACGFAQAAMGPFYCPGDEKVYLDLSFFQELEQRFGAPGDFARAYVIAHEVGHHVQDQFGVLSEVHARQQRLSKKEANALQVKVELQADFYAGVWAHHAQQRLNVLEPGDLEEALGAAAAVGDDRLQQQARGYVVPDSFTHGSSEQRKKWFKKGWESGRIEDGNTF